MNNSETIAKLSDALNTLIGAYEDLQNENTAISNKLKQVEDEKNELEESINNLRSDKTALEDNLDNLQDNKQKEHTNINSMLGKIQNLLGNKTTNNEPPVLAEINISINEAEKEVKSEYQADLITENIFDTVNLEEHEDTKEDETSVADLDLSGLDYSAKVEVKEEKKEEDGKLDLNRMASLLNGFK